MTSASTDRRMGLTSDKGMKAPVRAATNSNIVLDGLQTVDGVALVADDDVLVKDQTDSTENGIWIASTAPWTRRYDSNGTHDLVKGTVVHVNEGSHAGEYWSIITDNPIYPGVTGMHWDVSLTSGLSGSFLQAGTGAEARSYQDKMRDTFHAKDFGAVFNGVDDDTDALHLAIAALQAAGGGTLVLPAGTALVNDLIISEVAFAPISVVGQGQYSTILQKSIADANPVITIKSSVLATPCDSFSSFSDFTVSGLAFAGPGICLTLLARFALRNIAAQQCSIGIKNLGSLIFSAYDCTLYNNTNGYVSRVQDLIYCNAVSFHGGAFISNGTTATGAGYGIDLGATGSFLVSGTDFEKNGKPSTPTSGDVIIRSTCGTETGHAYVEFASCWHESNDGKGFTAEANSALNLSIKNALFIYNVGVGDINVGAIRSLVLDHVVATCDTATSVDIGAAEFARYNAMNLNTLSDAALVSHYVNVETAAGKTPFQVAQFPLTGIAGGYIKLDSQGQIILASNAATGISIDTAKLLPSGTNLVVEGPGGFAEGTHILGFSDTTGADVHAFFQTNGNSWNAAICALRVGKAVSNSRSINAGGTVNAGGTDYAEYETKSNLGDVFQPGEIVGFNSEGKLTKVFSESISFGIKSTSPALVGGDTWDPFLGKKDPLTAKERVEHEAARQAVDRIAYCGKVPVIYTGGTPGQYLVATDSSDAIDGEFVSDPSVAQLRNSVGRVRSVSESGDITVSILQQ